MERIEDFHMRWLVVTQVMQTVGVPRLGEAVQVLDFIMKLDQMRYGEEQVTMENCLSSGPEGFPDTIDEKIRIFQETNEDHSTTYRLCCRTMRNRNRRGTKILRKVIHLLPIRRQTRRLRIHDRTKIEMSVNKSLQLHLLSILQGAKSNTVLKPCSCTSN